MKKIRIGVMGLYRGASMINFCEQAENATVVAICDKWKEGIERTRERLGDDSVTYYTDFDEFIKHDMDAVVLANYANEHAPFAIRAMKAGKAVFSEVLPVETMSQAVELVEAVEQTGMTYCYGENYCYMPAPYEMRRLYRAGELGEVMYMEGEYCHNCEPIWPAIAYGDPTHWRNWMYSTFYCTHSIGPMVHITGLRPVRVTGFESDISYGAPTGKRAAAYGIEMLEMENGAIARSIHGSTYKDSIWYQIRGNKGMAESEREIIEGGANVGKIYVQADSAIGAYDNAKREGYQPTRPMWETANAFGHGGSDFYCLWNFVEKLRGNPEADTIDVYEALDMALPGLFAFRSILAGGIPMDIPDLRDKAVREKYRNDRACTNLALAGDQLLPTRKNGTPDFPDEVYAEQRRLWAEEQKKTDGHLNAVFGQGIKKKK